MSSPLHVYLESIVPPSAHGKLSTNAISVDSTGTTAGIDAPTIVVVVVGVYTLCVCDESAGRRVRPSLLQAARPAVARTQPETMARIGRARSTGQDTTGCDPAHAVQPPWTSDSLAPCLNNGDASSPSTPTPTMKHRRVRPRWRCTTSRARTPCLCAAPAV